MKALLLETDAVLNPLLRSGPLTFAGGGILLRTPELAPVGMYSARLGYVESPAHAEIEALFRGLQIARRCGATHVRARSNNHFRFRWDRAELRLSDRSLVRSVERLLGLTAELEAFDLRWGLWPFGWDPIKGWPGTEELAREAAGVSDGEPCDRAQPPPFLMESRAQNGVLGGTDARVRAPKGPSAGSTSVTELVTEEGPSPGVCLTSYAGAAIPPYRALSHVRVTGRGRK